MDGVDEDVDEPAELLSVGSLFEHLLLDGGYAGAGADAAEERVEREILGDRAAPREADRGREDPEPRKHEGRKPGSARRARKDDVGDIVQLQGGPGPSRAIPTCADRRAAYEVFFANV